MWKLSSRVPAVALLCICFGGSFLTAQEIRFDWERDTVTMKKGKPKKGVVLQQFDSDEIVLLGKGGKRSKIPRSKISGMDFHRMRLDAFMEKRGPDLSLESDWALVEIATSSGLHHMARLQAYHVLTRDPDHAPAHAFLGHKKGHRGWQWRIWKKLVEPEEFEQLSTDWKTRLQLQSEHFALETDTGLRNALDTLFDLEQLYLWWMENIGPKVLAGEDVDDPRNERVTFFVHASRDDKNFRKITSAKMAYYQPSSIENTAVDGKSIARTYYEGGERPVRLFDLGAQSLIFSTLIFSGVRGPQPPATPRYAQWAEVGLGFWVEQHCAGRPGYVEIRKPYSVPFTLNERTAQLSLDREHIPSPLTSGSEELANLIGLPSVYFHGTGPEILRARARCHTFMSFLIETDFQIMKRKKPIERRTREAIWYYFREVYGTRQGHGSDAFDTALGGQSKQLPGVRVEQLGDPWREWVATFK